MYMQYMCGLFSAAELKQMAGLSYKGTQRSTHVNSCDRVQGKNTAHSASADKNADLQHKGTRKRGN